jgi:catechol 2,3-dioxygenase-like lactoylglutathione lyase family enzyme
MSEWLRSVDVLTLFVNDVAHTKTFYQDVFGVSAIFKNDNSVVFNFDNLSINFLQRESAHDLITPAVVNDVSSGATFRFTVNVDSVDDACAELDRRGVALLNGPMDRPWGIRTASFTDPDGFIWEIAE